MLIGVVGKANVGKSSFFKAATLAEVEIANYPFATIKPNTGVAYVKVDCADKEFNAQCTPRTGYCIDHQRFVPFQLTDVAGLVPGASEGKGMGNEFLNDLNPADVLVHVVDMAGSTNEKGEFKGPGSYDPTNDILFLERELDMWFLSIFNRNFEKVARTIQSTKQHPSLAITKQMSGLKVTETIAREALRTCKVPEDPVAWTEQDRLLLASELRRRTKPIIIAANKIDLPSADRYLNAAREKFRHLTIVPCCADAEIALREAAKKGLIHYIPGERTFTITGAVNEKQQQALSFIQEQVLNKYGSTGVQQVLDTAVFSVLKYKAIFPGGVNNLKDSEGRTLPDCFLLPEQATALDFAAVIHSDLAKNFIRAIDVRTKKVVGKDHLLQHRDVLEIVTKK